MLRHQVESALGLAWAYILQGDVSRARSRLEAAQQVARTAGTEIRSVAIDGFPGGSVVPSLLDTFSGEWDEAETGLVQLLEVSEEIQRPTLKHLWANPALGWLNLERGELAATKAQLGEAASFCQTVGDQPPELLCRALLVQVACKAGELEEAAAHLGLAREIFSLSPDWYGLAAEVHLAEAMLAAAKQRWEEAETSFRQAVETNHQYHLPYFEARCLLESGEMYLRRNGPGDRASGMPLLDQALDIFQRVQAKKMVEKVLARKELLRA